ncbi:hypothetical protein, partial [Streptococcus agalactiae]|uniref:hypothetical protein n=1 Tax=Streptococcus agalactiae TaxID=1311 RepID=UPI001E5F362E
KMAPRRQKWGEKRQKRAKVTSENEEKWQNEEKLQNGRKKGEENGAEMGNLGPEEPENEENWGKRRKMEEK